MKTIFRSANPTAEKGLPLLGLQLIVTLALYAAGFWAVLAVSGGARLPVILFAVYFLPAVLRAWLQVYWRLRDDLKSLGGPRQRTNKAL